MTGNIDATIRTALLLNGASLYACAALQHPGDPMHSRLIKSAAEMMATFRSYDAVNPWGDWGYDQWNTTANALAMLTKSEDIHNMKQHCLNLVEKFAEQCLLDQHKSLEDFQ
jgi:hypothetical protein